MNELSLFTGAGGGLLGTKLLGWKAIGYVEKEPYCQKVIRQRIADGILDAAPIFGDIRKFISDGYAASYTGLVDVLTAGFPCQPFSVAGKRKQADDERNMWPATADVIGIVKPRFVLLENVPGVREYLPVVIRDLRRCGYEVRHPLQLGADDVGAPHRRKRVWILAYSRLFRQKEYEKQAMGFEQLHKGGAVADTETIGVERNGASGQQEPATHEGQELFMCRSGNWWATEPDVGRVAYGVASRVDRLKAIGNGQVPGVVRAAWRILMDT